LGVVATGNWSGWRWCFLRVGLSNERTGAKCVGFADVTIVVPPIVVAGVWSILVSTMVT